MATSSRISMHFMALAALALLAACAAEDADRETSSRREGQTAEKTPLNLEYIANAGVLVSCGDTAVLIDALFDKPNPEYRAPSQDILNKIANGEIPYDGVDLALVTHNHPDHFDASLASRFMETVPDLILLAPADAVAAMREAAASWEQIESRVVSLDLEIGEKMELDPKRISVTAFRTLHSGSKESPMNVMYLFELGDWRVFHEGDSGGNVDDFQDFGLGGAEVDLALVHFWFPLNSDWARFLQEVLDPDHIALTHLPIRLEGETPAKIEQVRELYKDIFLLMPEMPAKVFHKEAPGVQNRG